ncbi:HNH endonuclease [Pseudomonas alliivorans]|nr:HNH endonuclease [Pseudomonas alliivorans]
MNPNDKAAWRALLTERVAGYESQQGAVETGAGTIEDYIQALREVEPRVTEIQLRMLIGHARAPDQALTMAQIARLGGGEGHHFANLHYGKLARLLTEALGLRPPDWWVYTLATFDDRPGFKGRVAQLHRPLLEALLQLNWMRDEKCPVLGHTSRPVTRQAAALGGATIMNGMLRAGFIRANTNNVKVALFRHPAVSDVLYVKLTDSNNSKQRTPLVVAPRCETHVSDWLQIDGVIGGDEQYYHNDDMGKFPRRRHTGVSDVHYGIDLGMLGEGALQAFLTKWLKSETGRAAFVAEPASINAVVQDFGLGRTALNETEKDALIKARIGQGAYRDALVAHWRGCAVTGCRLTSMLRASHIKPWHRCADDERLNPFNGLLLTPNLDIAFDQGLISFKNDGEIMLSTDLSLVDAALLGLREDMRLRAVAVEHWTYLQWHRDNWFKG